MYSLQHDDIEHTAVQTNDRHHMYSGPIGQLFLLWNIHKS